MGDSEVIGLKILVAEDDYANRIFLLRFLEKKGYEATGVEDGGQALEELRRRPYDLLLLDVRMPVLNGSELARVIREGRYPEIDPELPIVAVTAQMRRRNGDDSLSSGMTWYLTKPLDIKQLFDIVSIVEEKRSS